jgi:Ca-activated chloride channel homolog
VAGGGTNLNGAVCRAIEKMKTDSTTSEDRLNGIVLLSDGADTEAEISETKMFQTCLSASSEAASIKIFSIAFGATANPDALFRISQATGGALFTANAATIDQAYLKISAEQ